MGQRGPKPGSGGRPKKAIADKIADGNPGKRPLTVIDFKDSAADLEGQAMPKPSEFLSAKQKDGSTLCAAEIYENVWKWLSDRGCVAIVSPQLIERFVPNNEVAIHKRIGIVEYKIVKRDPHLDIIAAVGCTVLVRHRPMREYVRSVGILKRLIIDRFVPLLMKDQLARAPRQILDVDRLIVFVLALSGACTPRKVDIHHFDKGFHTLVPFRPARRHSV